MLASMEELESDYRRFAEEHGAATQRGDHRCANSSYKSLIAIVRKIRERQQDGETILIRLMRDENLSVACWAATHCLPFAEIEALSVLDALARTHGIIGFGAKMTAQQWRSGQLVIE